MSNTCTDVLQQDILEDAYCHVQNLITDICWKFTRRYGGDFYEWLSEANMLFLDACRTHNGRSSLVTWVWLRVHWGLYTMLRNRIKEQNHPKTISFEELREHGITVEDLFPAPTQQSIETLINHVSESSQELWGLILDPPEELKGELDENNPESTWDAIQRYCEWKLRWTCREMRTAITELKELCTE